MWATCYEAEVFMKLGVYCGWVVAVFWVVVTSDCTSQSVNR